MVHMRTVNSVAMPDRESGMGLQRAYLAAVVGKHRGNKSNGTIDPFIAVRRLLIAAAGFVVASVSAPVAHAQSSGPFAGMAGTWSGSGTVTLDDGSTERIRCRATYGVSGPNLTMGLTCASDAYKFNLSANVLAEGSDISGNWSESSRNVSGVLSGRGGNGSFQVAVQAAGFNANISLTTRGNKQSVVMKADSQFRGATIALSK
jgi:hypothetical protein